MKQTNNAIKFLMAQYRAIFHNAYFKGLASAALVTVAMAAGQAHAATELGSGSLVSDSIDGALKLESIVTKDAENTLTLDGQKKYVNGINVAKGTKLTVSGDFVSVADVVVDGTLDIASGKSLLLSSTEQDVNSQKELVYNKNLTVNAGAKVNMSGNIGVHSFKVSEATLTLASGGKNGTNLTAHGERIGETAPTKYDGVGTLTKVTATLGDSSNITAIGNLTVTEGTYNLNGAVSDLQSKAYNLTYLEGSRNLDINKATINVSGGTNALSGRNIVLSGSTVDLKDASSKLTIGTDYDVKQFASDSGAGTAIEGKITVKDSTVKLVASSELNFGASGSKASVAFEGKNTIENKGTVNFYTPTVSMGAADLNALVKEGKADFKTENTVLTVSGDLDLNTNGVIKSGDGTLDNSKLAVANKLKLNGDKVILGSKYAASSLDISASTLQVAKGEKFEFTSGSLTANSALTADAELKSFLVSGGALVLGKDGNANGSVSNINAFDVAGDAASSLTVNGKWDFGGADLSAGKSGSITIVGTADKVGAIKVADASGAFSVDGTLNAQRLLDGASGSINVNGTLAIVGDGKDDKNSDSSYNNDLSIANTTVDIKAGGTFDVSAADVQDDFLDFAEPDASGNTAVTLKTDASGDFGGWKADNVKLAAGGHLVFDFTGKTMTADAINNFQKAIVSGGSTSVAGIVDIKGVALAKEDLDKIVTTDKDTGETTANLDKIIENNLAGVAIDSIKDLKATVSTTNAGNMQGSVGAIEAAKGSTDLAVDKTLTLNNAAVNGGNFVSVAGATGPADVKLKDNSAFELNGQGKIGNIAKETNGGSLIMNATAGKTQSAGTIDVLNLTIKSGNVEAKDVTADKLVLSGNLTSLEKSTDVLSDITAKTLETAAGSVITTGKLTVGAANNDSTALDSIIKGQVNAATIAVSDKEGNTLSILDGSVKADSLSFGASGGKLIVGMDGDNGATGELNVKTLNLSGGMLLLDPAWGEKATLAFVDQAGTDTVVGGNIGVGQNAAFIYALNADKQAEADAKAILARYTDGNGSLKQDGVGALFITNKVFTVGSGEKVVVNPSLVSSDKTLENAVTAASGDSFALEKGSALVIGEDLTEAIITRDGTAPTKVAITFKNSGSATFDAKADSSIVFDGNVFAGDQVKISDANTVNLNGTVEAGNGVLEAKNANGIMTFVLPDDWEVDLYNQSTPVKYLTKDVFEKKFGTDLDTGAQYIQDIGGHEGGKAVEGTARLAVYGGVVQGTALAQSAANDAVSERMSRSNPNGSLVFANNAQGGGLWLSPVYKNHESDSFDSEGVEYGVDGDLTALVLGADSTSENGVRIGGYFNFGSYDFDGQGVGDQVSNEADYFGFGLYAGMSVGQLSLLADAGFTQVSNDIEQSVNYGDYSTVTADVDSSAVTLGLRGEYKLSVASMDVTPHLGVRYTRLEIDSYDAKEDGKVLATTGFDTMQMFSIPFGVTVSKDIAAGDWTIKPVFDLTLTANAGDTDAKLKTTFIGTRNLDLTSEAFDSFTYGATFGIDAKYGENFSIGLNTNYTGSSNTDEFGVMGNARYMF